MARPPATASGWRHEPEPGAGIRRPLMPPGRAPRFETAPGGRTASLSAGRDGVAAGREACQRAAHVLRYATALRVTRPPPRSSDGSYGPCGPAWTGRPGRHDDSPDAADSQDARGRGGPKPPSRGCTRRRPWNRRCGSTYAVSSGVSFRCRQGVSFECRLTVGKRQGERTKRFKRILPSSEGGIARGRFKRSARLDRTFPLTGRSCCG